jgi:hypothetical protein
VASSPHRYEPAQHVRPGDHRRRDGGGSPLPCQPESRRAPVARGRRPAVAGCGHRDRQRSACCAWKTATGPEGRDMSGLVFDPSNPNVLWAVKNKSWLFRLIKQGDVWVPDTADGWAGGKQILLPGGAGQPDSEGSRSAGDGAFYVTTERRQPAQHVRPRLRPPLRPAAPGATLARPLSGTSPPTSPSSSCPAGQDQGQPRLRGRHLRARHLPGAARASSTSRPVDVRPRAPSRPRHRPLLRASRTTASCTPTPSDADGSAHRVAVVDTGMGHVHGRPVRRRPPAHLGALRQHVLGLVDRAAVDATGRSSPTSCTPRRPACRT